MQINVSYQVVLTAKEKKNARQEDGNQDSCVRRWSGKVFLRG